MLNFVFYVCKCFTCTVCRYTMFMPGSHIVQRRALGPQEQEVVMSSMLGLGIRTGSSGEAARPLNC